MAMTTKQATTDNTTPKITVKEGQANPLGGSMADINVEAYEGEYFVIIRQGVELTVLKHDNQLPRIFDSREEARRAAQEWVKDQ
jgi:hypothetical protein